MRTNESKLKDFPGVNTPMMFPLCCAGTTELDWIEIWWGNYEVRLEVPDLSDGIPAAAARTFFRNGFCLGVL